MSNKAVLIVNLGSPDSTSIEDVRKYLKEFLSDDRVIDSPKLIQQTVLRCFILPSRPKRSAKAYRSVWQPEGSPLIITSRNLRNLLQDQVEEHVELAMRYGTPSIPGAIANLKAKGIEELLLVPLYPHYAMSSYETVVVKVMDEIRKTSPKTKVTTMQPFYADPGYIEALYASAAPYLEKEFDHLLFSYHGIPERHLRKADSSKGHCLQVDDCCRTCSPARATCYRAHITATTEALVKRAGIPDDKYSISFQSRLGREPWLRPYTDKVLQELPKKGIETLAIITPAFVSDCLETLEEIAEEGKEIFLEAGGKEFITIPCMNEHPKWVSYLANQIQSWSNGETRIPITAQ